MADGDCTLCGHERRSHERWKGQCLFPVEGVDAKTGRRLICHCTHFTTAVLPAGERLEFGRHRLPQDEAELAPAWPPIR